MSVTLKKPAQKQALCQAARLAAEKLVQQFSLPLSGKTWSGQSGSRAGHGVGNSIDFEDHRAYLPGDDPRHIDWQAYARSGQYIMKLYREEVSPAVDIIFDVSASMFLTPAKAKLSTLLFYFAWNSALENGASPAVWQLCGDKTRKLTADEIMQGNFDMITEKSETSGMEYLQLRPKSLRIWISDLLFPGDPADSLHPLLQANGQLLIYAPADPAEGQPQWRGNMDILDIETSALYRRFVDEHTLKRYLKAYKNHFSLWHEEARKNAAGFGHFTSAVSLTEQLRDQGLRKMLVEPAL